MPRGAAWLGGALARPFVLIGQQGLPVFCAGIFLAFLGRLAIEQSEDWAMQAAVNAAGLGVLVAIAAVVAWSDGPLPKPSLPARAAPDTA